MKSNLSGFLLLLVWNLEIRGSNTTLWKYDLFSQWVQHSFVPLPPALFTHLVEPRGSVVQILFTTLVACPTTEFLVVECFCSSWGQAKYSEGLKECWISKYRGKWINGCRKEEIGFSAGQQSLRPYCFQKLFISFLSYCPGRLLLCGTWLLYNCLQHNNTVL